MWLVKVIKQSFFLKILLMMLLLAAFSFLTLGLYTMLEVKSLSGTLTQEQINRSTKKTIEHKFLHLENEAKIIDLGFEKVEKNLKLIQQQAEFLFANTEQVNFNKEITLVEMEEGYLWEPYIGIPNERANLFISSITAHAVDELIEDLQKAKQLEPLLKQTIDNEPILKGVYFILSESAWILYPAINAEIEVFNNNLPPDIRVQDYEFYYIADPVNNPERTIKWTNIYQDVTQWDSIVTATIPVYLPNGSLRGVIGADFPIAVITKQIQKIDFDEPNAFAYLIDKGGNFIAGDFTKFNNYKKDIVNHQAIEKIAGIEEGIKIIESQTENYFHLFSPITSSDWILNYIIPESDIINPIIFESEKHTEEQLTNFYHRLFAFLFFTIIVLVVLSYFFSKSVTKPVQKLISIIKRNPKGNHGTQIPVQSTDEIGKLTQTFNEMSTTIHQYVIELNERAEQLEDRVIERTEELQRANKELYHTYNKLKVSEKSRSVLILQISHDLKTPLTTIKGYLEVIKNYNPSAEVQKEYVSTILLQTNHIIHLINDLFDLASFEVANLKFEKEWVSIDFVIDHAVEIISKGNHDKELLISTQYEEDLPLLFVDLKKMNRAFLNILGNAIKYSKQKENIIINIAVSQKFDKVFIHFEDNGMGIAEENRKKVFEPFFREERATNKKINGSGLGISITKKIVEGHDGEMFIESQVGIGTKVTFVLPVIEEHFENEAALP